MERLLSLVGLTVLVAVTWAMSENRKKVNPRVILGGLAIQLVVAALVLKTEFGLAFFDFVKVLVNKAIEQSDKGAEFVFGKDFREHFFAFKVLTTIIFFSSLSSVLFYLGIIQHIIRFFASGMYRIMGVSGSESLAAAANIFLGQTEAPLAIKNYLPTMTRSEIMCMMTGGMATVAGGVLAAYVGFGIDPGHLLSASIISAPAAIMIAKIMVPETEHSVTRGKVEIDIKLDDTNVFDAACRGASEGLKLALNVGAMLIAFISLVSLLNFILGWFGSLVGVELSMELILSYLFYPFALLMGVSAGDALVVGELIGTKTVVNEFLAYIKLGDLMASSAISERSAVIATYALCGFANFSSIAIQIGGIGALCPERKSDFARYGFKSMVGGTLASFMTACMASLLL